MLCNSSSASKYQPNEFLPSETKSQNKHFFKNDSFFTHGDKVTGDANWPKNRILKPAKSTPSLLHITDEPKINATLMDHSSTREGMGKFENIELLRPAFHGK